MSEGSSKLRKIDLGEDFGDVVVKANGTQVKIDADGRIFGVPAEANDDAKGKTAPKVGDEMADGTIYAGISPDTHKPMYARPKDESGTYNFNEAAKQAKNIGDGFHVPTRDELNVLYENRSKGKLKGTFSETGCIPPDGTGRLRRTTATLRGRSASAKGFRATSTGASTRPCGWSGEPAAPGDLETD